MELIKLAANMQIKECVACIGEFDGMHIAHQKLIDYTIIEAKKRGLSSALVCFYPHPDYVLKVRDDEGYLNTIEEKCEMLDEKGIDILYLIPFSLDLMKMDREKFYNSYLSKLKFLICGEDFKFGYEATGDALFLKDKFKDNIKVFLKQTYMDGKSNKKISSEDIRRFLKEGNIKNANNLLGYNYYFEGVVKKGSNIGKSLGFPTANIDILKEKFIPRNGVYASKVIIDGEIYFGLANIGNNPSINLLKDARLEVNILSFNKDIYGKKIKVELCKFIRDEIVFKSKDDLIRRIEKDKEDVLLYFKENENE